MTIASDVGDRIRAARARAGLSREALAARLGSTAGTVRTYECGHRLVSVVRLVAIAEALGVEPGTLLDGVRLTQRRK